MYGFIADLPLKKKILDRVAKDIKGFESFMGIHPLANGTMIIFKDNWSCKPIA